MPSLDEAIPAPPGGAALDAHAENAPAAAAVKAAPTEDDDWMARAAIGSRVGAILSSYDEEVHVVGFGTYVGDEVPGPEASGMARMCRMANRPNPCIRLDSGEKVYGAECWWGEEERVRAYIGGRSVRDAPPSTWRPPTETHET